MAGSFIVASLALAAVSLQGPAADPSASGRPISASQPVAEPGADEPDPTAEPDTPDPEPMPEPDASADADFGTSATPTATAAAATDDETAPTAASVRNDAPDDGSPVVRPEQGQWGMQFTFGGLAPMSIAGIDTLGVNRLLFSELGFRRVLGNGWVVPFSIGAGVFHHNPEMGPSQNDVGLSGSVGIKKWFRQWRRIAPFAGGDFRISYLDPTGDNNWLVGIGLGPNLGIEYFVGDRVSLVLQGDANIAINVFDGLVQVDFGTAVSFGGQMGLAFYF